MQSPAEERAVKQLRFLGIYNGLVWDTVTTKRAVYVNTIHALDSLFLRKIVSKLYIQYGINVFGIHDGFGIGYKRVGLLLTVANEAFYYRLELGSKPLDNGTDIRVGGDSLLI